MRNTYQQLTWTILAVKKSYQKGMLSRVHTKPCDPSQNFKTPLKAGGVYTTKFKIAPKKPKNQQRLDQGHQQNQTQLN